MLRRILIAYICILLIDCCPMWALQPEEILVIVNRQIEDSRRIAEYYCRKRKVPEKNILYIALGSEPQQRISREDYDKILAHQVRQELLGRMPGEIRCLLTTYGVPISVGRRSTLPGMGSRLNQLETSIELHEQQLAEIEQNDTADGEKGKQLEQKIARMKLEVDRINGRETNASVDSELSMVLLDPYELYRWQVNGLRGDSIGLGYGTVMVSRLDGPDYITIKALIDKALIAEHVGLKGTAYIDSRGFARKDVMGLFDMAMRDLASYLRTNTNIPVREEITGDLFGPGECPDTVLYCGWYSLRNYVDAFDYVDGAVGYHIASFEAQGLRDPNSTTWCAAMIRDGITATLGAVSEPYLQSFPNPRAFFPELLKGRCLVEAYYRTKPFNSWQLVLLGDPLYRPFGRPRRNSASGQAGR